MPFADMLIIAIFVSLAFVAFRLLFAGGLTAAGRLKCVDPLAAWIQVTNGPPPEVRVRVSLTFFLAGARAKDTTVADLLLRVRGTDEEFELGLAGIADIDGRPWSGPVVVNSDVVTELVTEFVGTEAGLVKMLDPPKLASRASIAMKVDGSNSWTLCTKFMLVRTTAPGVPGKWQRVLTQKS